MRMRVLVDSSLVTAVGLVVIIGSAGADSMSVSRGQPVAETAHAVAVHVADGVATFTVQRRFYNPGNQAEQVGLEIRLPEGAAATGLRIKARQRWYTGELMEASAASERYRSLTGYGAFQVKDPALLSWMAVGTLFLQVFPVMPKTVSTVEYTLVEGGVEGGVVGGDLNGVAASAIIKRPDLAAMLGAMIDAHACFATDKREVTLAIDTTHDEIVDVAVVGAADPAARCVAEATWRVRLDNRFDRAHERFTIAVRPVAPSD